MDAQALLLSRLLSLLPADTVDAALRLAAERMGLTKPDVLAIFLARTLNPDFAFKADEEGKLRGKSRDTITAMKGRGELPVSTARGAATREAR